MKIVHATIFANNIDQSVQFYQDVIGLSVIRDMRDGDHKVCFLNDGTQDFCLEIAQGNDDMHYAGEGISLGVHCDDLDKERIRLTDIGISVGEEISPNPHVRFFFIADPDGFQIQFVEEKQQAG